MKIEPFGERVAIKILQPEEKTAGGLIVATSKSSSNRGEVVALGQDIKGNFKLGDRVIFLQGSGINYTDGTEEYKVVNAKDVVCKIIED